MADLAAVRAEMARLWGSSTFVRSEKLLQFLRFTVEESLAGRGLNLKEYVIGVEVYGRPADYNPKIDSIVRSEAARLRAKLSEYYTGEGKRDSFRICYPKGGYVVSVRRAPSSEGQGGWVMLLEWTDQRRAAASRKR